MLPFEGKEGRGTMKTFGRVLTFFGVLWIFGGFLSLTVGRALGLVTMALGVACAIGGQIIAARASRPR